MPYCVHSVEGTSFVFARLFDEFGLDDSLSLLGDMVRDHEPLKGKRIICDVTDGAATLSFDELLTIAAFVRAREQNFSGMKWAMVVADLLEFGLARTAGLLTADVPYEYGVFRSIDEACSWAGVPRSSWTLFQESIACQSQCE